MLGSVEDRSLSSWPGTLIFWPTFGCDRSVEVDRVEVVLHCRRASCPGSSDRGGSPTRSASRRGRGRPPADRPTTRSRSSVTVVDAIAGAVRGSKGRRRRASRARRRRGPAPPFGPAGAALRIPAAESRERVAATTWTISDPSNQSASTRSRPIPMPFQPFGVSGSVELPAELRAAVRGVKTIKYPLRATRAPRAGPGLVCVPLVAGGRVLHLGDDVRERPVLNTARRLPRSPSTLPSSVVSAASLADREDAHLGRRDVVPPPVVELGDARPPCANTHVSRRGSAGRLTLGAVGSA